MNISDLCTQLEAETGVNPTFVYCAVTGKPFAAIHYDELSGLIARFGTDIDTAKDELLIATLNAMRPAPSVSSLNPDSIHSLRLTNPRMLLSYLLGRYLTPRDTVHGLKRTYESRIKLHRERIALWQVIAAAPISDIRLNQLLLALLQLDSRFNLNDVAPHKDVTLYTFVTCQSDESFKDLILTIQQQLESLMAKKAKDEQEAKMSAEYWARGSSLTRKATVALFMEVTPPSATKAKQIEKKKQENDFLSVLEEILDSGDKPKHETPAAPAPAAKIPGFIKPGAFRLNLAKKG